MKLALNGATTMKADLATDIRVAGEVGFDCLEIWAPKLFRFLETESLGALGELFSAARIQPYTINSIERITFRDARGRGALLAECEELCRLASGLHCPYIVVVPSPLPNGAGEADVIEESSRILIELGQIAEGFDVGLAFEFLGQKDCSVQTLSLAAEIVSRVNRTSIGLVIDTFHFYAGGSTFESIAELDPNRLFVLHINDAEDMPLEKLEDRHRLLPGLGILPLKRLIGRLKEIGYDGVASVEIFRPEYWEREPGELAREARATAAQVLGIEGRP